MKATIEGKILDFYVLPHSVIKSGDPCLVSIDGMLVVGRFYLDADGSGWLIQSDRAIQISEKQD